MKVTFNPNNYQPTGLVSFASWSNGELHEAMRRLFHESSRERLVEIIVEQEGIKALFEPRQLHPG